MGDKNRCRVCGMEASVNLDINPPRYFYTCPVCGKYEYYVGYAELTEFDLNHLGAYLVYHGFHDEIGEHRYFTTMSKDCCDEYRKNFEQGDTTHGYPVRLIKENIENWYPKTFAEKVDYILLYLNSHIKHMGESIVLRKEEAFSCLFVDRFDYKNNQFKIRSDNKMREQASYMIDYLIDNSYVLSSKSWGSSEYSKTFSLAPAGYARVDILQKNTANGKNVLVAMKFGDDTMVLREAIRQGVTDAGYVAIFIDEVEHNDFITPELLKYIKDSKFVVVDLSHQNNGAYFEEGYAMGLGKPVIQLCKKSVQLHFDIAQKNTIMWETEDEIAERLKNRILATID